MFNCKICNQECKSKGINSHLTRRHQISSKDYYDKYIKTESEGKCKICGKETRFDTIFSGYNIYCSSSCANLDPEIRAKIETTNLERFGAKGNFGRKDINKKAIKHSQSDEAKIKRNQTNINRYGFENPYASDQVKDKIKQYNLEKYGVEYSWQRDDVKKKSKQTSLAKYRTEHPQQSNKVKTKVRQLKLSRLQTFAKENKCTSRESLIQTYGFGWIYVLDKIDIQYIYCGNNAFVKNKDVSKIEKYNKINHYQSSLFEQEIISYIKSIYDDQIITNTREILKPYELDIYIPNKNLAIECNGTFWHDSLHKEKSYHIEKSKNCQDKGIRLIHIYEWEWLQYPEKIKQLLNIVLGSVSKIYACQCDIRVISNNEAKPFNETTHLQGHRNAKVTYGLFYKDQLVQLMSFSKTRYNRNLKNDNEWKIIRDCPESNNIVVGGVSKLFKHFINDYKPTKVFSYCDFNKFNGKSYIALGMQFIGYTGPNKWCVLSKDNVVLRNPKLYSELKKYPIIWGSGSMKFEWTNRAYN